MKQPVRTLFGHLSTKISSAIGVGLIRAGFVCAGLSTVLPAWALDFSGPMGLEIRAFTNDGETQYSGYVQPKLQWSTENSAFNVELFARYDDLDDERSHADIREATWLYITDHWELKTGIGKIFWGVTETQHLVDIINQTDSVEAIDGEDKLGQPMVQLTLVRDWGMLNLFVLPYFRERTFPGPDGRLGPTQVDTDNPRFESGDEENHIDVAARYSHYIGNWDFGLSYFQGTNRDPKLLPEIDPQQGLVLIPYYDQIKQLGLDLQATLGAWLWKLETIAREDSADEYLATVGGFEYTLFGIKQSALDWGLLLELSYDSRGEEGPAPGQKDVAFANRITFNDVNSTEILFGMTLDLDDKQRKSGFLEASRRFGNHWKLSAEGRVFVSHDEQDPVYLIRDDDHVQLNIEYYF